MTQPETTAVFYSWQSDLLPKDHRYFIQDALKQAVTAIRNDATVLARPEVDQSVQGVPGARRIDEVIFSKIRNSVAFVADVSFINAGAEEKRLTPNPNVLVEVGYALHNVDEDNLILVFNTATGEPEKLPFDLRGRTILPYTLHPDADGKKDVRQKLARDLDGALRLIIERQEAELRVAQIHSAEAALAQAKGFRDTRLALLRSSNRPVGLIPGVTAVMHIVPLTPFTVDETGLTQLNQGAPITALPPAARVGTFWRRRRNDEGFISYNTDEMPGGLSSTPGVQPRTVSYLQLFRDGGAVEGAGLITAPEEDKHRIIASDWLEDNLIQGLGRYLTLLRDLHVPLPVVVMVSILNAAEYRLSYASPSLIFRQLGTIDRNPLIVPHVEVTDYRSPAHTILKPIFDRLWHTVGLDRSPYYNGQGQWIRQTF